MELRVALIRIARQDVKTRKLTCSVPGLRGRLSDTIARRLRQAIHQAIQILSSELLFLLLSQYYICCDMTFSYQTALLVLSKGI